MRDISRYGHHTNQPTLIYHSPFHPQFEVRQTSVRPFVSDVYLVKRTDGRINIELQNPLLIVGDVKIDFTQKIKLDILNLSGR